MGVCGCLLKPKQKKPLHLRRQMVWMRDEWRRIKNGGAL
jgi:hypothetical protein